MNPVVNLIVFSILCLAIWLIIWLSKNKNLSIDKINQRKTLTEDVLKQLYHVEQSNRTATLSDLSGALKVRRRTILPVVEAMASSSLIESTDEVLNLTRDGREYALKMVRIHRLWEKYLAERTGHKAADWHHLAEKMEHKLKEEEISQLNSSLGNPLFDPHGDPIPSEIGEVIDVKWQPLPSFPENVPGKIVHIEDEPGVIYQQILKKRIFIGSHIKVLKSSSSELIISCEGEEHSFSPIVGANINVEQLNEAETYEENAIRLSSLSIGEQAEVIGISQECRGASRRRLLDLGVLPGTPVEIDIESPLKDPIAYRVRNTSIALRNSLADMILINKSI